MDLGLYRCYKYDKHLWIIHDLALSLYGDAIFLILKLWSNRSLWTSCPALSNRSGIWQEDQTPRALLCCFYTSYIYHIVFTNTDYTWKIKIDKEEREYICKKGKHGIHKSTWLALRSMQLKRWGWHLKTTSCWS